MAKPRRPEQGGSRAPAPAHGFFASWRAELPGVAASLTTALVLFVASMAFPPIRGFFFGRPAVDYPIFCTADATRDARGRFVVEVFIVNRSDDDLTANQLQQRLNRALEGSGLGGDAQIFLKADAGLSIGEVGADPAFNGDKGEIGLVAVPGGVRITIGRISGRSILRGLIEIPDRSRETVSRSARGASVPFELGDLHDNCYSSRSGGR